MSDQKDQEKPPTSYAWWGLIVIPIAILILAMRVYRTNFGSALSNNHATWGEFGDFLGGIMNPVVGLITITLLIVTLTAQRQELALQRKDMRRSADALDAQHKAIQIQSFEQTLFKWFDNYRQILKEIEHISPDDPEDIVKGLNAVRRINKEILTLPDEVRQHFGKDYKLRDKWLTVDQELIENTFNKITTRVSRIHRAEVYSDLATAIRTIYGLFRWIHDNETFKNDKKHGQIYANIIRAQLSEHELRLLFVFGLIPAGAKVAKYADRLGLFDNMRAANSYVLTVLLLSDKNPYTRAAFGEQKITATWAKTRRAHTVKRETHSTTT